MKRVGDGLKNALRREESPAPHNPVRAAEIGGEPVKRMGEGLKNLLFPQSNVCLLCGRGLAGVQATVLCPECAKALYALRVPSADLMAPHPPLALCAGTLWHAEGARTLVHKLKYQSTLCAARPLAELMSLAYYEAGMRADVVIPVPLHPSRMRERGYNQAEVLAGELCSHLELPMRPERLIRVKEVGSQVNRTREQRLSALQNSFVARDVRGLNVLVVDDVLTTGATVTACGHALLDAGAASVCALTANRA